MISLLSIAPVSCLLLDLHPIPRPVPARRPQDRQRRLRDQPLTQLGVNVPRPIATRLDLLLFGLEQDLGVNASRRELVAALMLEADDPDALATALPRYRDATVHDANVPDYPSHWILIETGSPGPRSGMPGPLSLEDYDPLLDGDLPHDDAELRDRLRERLSRCRSVRIGIAVPRPLSARLDQLVELVERRGTRTSRQEILALLLFLAPDEGTEPLHELLRRYRLASVDDAPIKNGPSASDYWSSPDTPPRGRRPRPPPGSADSSRR